ncbi:MAG: DNA-directed RNA polymerase subunit alpha, partial [Bacteroidetes bacterium QS_1_63_11]
MSNQGLQMPEGVQVDEDSDSEGQFVMGPLERGYGVTIGNALRRVLLSSLRGLAITAVKIDGVQHEFSTISGVTEDVSDIILNLKEVRFKADEMREGHLHLNLEGPGSWTAEDIDEAGAEYEVLNPDQHIATLAEDAVVNVDLRVGYGRGYIPSEENKREDDPI